MLLESAFACAVRAKILLSLDQRNFVRTAHIPRIEQLDSIVFPKADLTDVERPWTLAKRPEAARRTGEFGDGHDV